MNALRIWLPVNVCVGQVENAAATLINGQPYIIYSEQFLGSLFYCNTIAVRTVLAHEVGHHIDGDTWPFNPPRQPWDKELWADWVSGFAMARMGVALSDATGAIQCYAGIFGPQLGSRTHPSGPLRGQVVAAGWHDGHATL